MSKNKKHKRKSVLYNSSGIVKYGSDKYVILIIVIYLSVVLSKAMKYERIIGIFIIPLLIPVLFMFRFCVKYDLRQRKIYLRYFFSFREINFSDIKKIYKKSDGVTTFLIIKTNKNKIHINMRSCKSAREFYFFLKRHIPKKINEY